jgi:hypothetical protein
MTYVNTTGKNIGQCLTGFAVSYPLSIYNSGNSQVQYVFNNSNATNFALSQSSLLLDSSDYGNVDIYYIPTVSAPSGTQSTTITINSESTEDGSTDPSGSITLQITGNKIIDITGGYIRSFKAVRNYDSQNKLNYDFYWSVPTGTENLNNYFFTGYNLEISTVTNFSTTVFSKNINISENTNAFPKYGNFYGTDQYLNYLNVSSADYPFAIETDYYARMYTISVNHSGISIYATGVDSASTQLSNEVVSGYSGTPKNIKFSRGPLVVNLKQGYDIQNFDLFKYIVDANYGKPDLSYYNSIDVYLPEDSTFSSTDSNKYALQLDGIFENFTGNTGGDTIVNIYIPSTTRLLGYQGAGGQIINQNLNSYDPFDRDWSSLINQTIANYTAGSFADSKNGGSILKLAAKTSINSQTAVSDIKYNLYIQDKSSLQSGGGGSKAGIVMTKNGLGGRGNDYVYQNGNFPIQGASNSFNTRFDLVYSSYLNTNTTQINSNSTQTVGYWFSPQAGYGESGSQTVVYYLNPNTNFTNTDSKGKANSFNEVDVITSSKNNFQYGLGNLFVANFKPVNITSTNQLCGNLITSFSNSSVLLNVYNKNLPSDYIFRFPNSGISNTAPNYWVGGSYTLTGTAAYSANYKSLGYKALTLTNQFLSTPFTDSVLCNDFDLYIVAAIEEVTTPFNTLAGSSTSFKFLDWYLTETNVSFKHLLYTKYLTSSYNYYPKEPNVFQSFLTPLFDARIDNSSSFFGYDGTKTIETNFAQISKSLNTSNPTYQTYYPVIINIKRSKTFYSVFINGTLLTSYDLLALAPEKSKSSSLLINDIKGTTFKLINDLTSLKVSYFDIACYNRLLIDNEQININNYFIDTYFKLFTGETSATYDIRNKSFRLPNIFNIAGTSSIAS